MREIPTQIFYIIIFLHERFIYYTDLLFGYTVL